MGVAVGATTVSTALITGTTTTLAPPEVTLAALVTPANSTSQILAGKVYYGEDQTNVYGRQTVVPFFLGPRGIVWAVRGLEDETDPNTTGNALFASGWGAGQASTALAMMDEEDLDNLDVVVLDNNTNRAGGGFWTTYAVFAPLLLTSAEPTPNDIEEVPVIDVAYQYNINSNAPTNPLNLFATANSLVAYVYGYGGEQHAVLPEGEDWDDPSTETVETEPVPGYHYVVNPDGTIDQELSGPVKDSNITYVTYVSEDLPLLRPLRSIPGGEPVADALEPTVTRLVEAGYADGQSIPEDPSVPRPMDLSLWGQQSQEDSSFSDLDADASVADEPDGLRGELEARLDAATIHEKTNKPLLRSPIDMTEGEKVAPTPNTSSTREADKPVRRVVDSVRSTASDARENLRNAKNDARESLGNAKKAARQGGIGERQRSRDASSDPTS